MVINGHVEKGQIVLDQELLLQEGMKVRIELLATETDEAHDSLEASTLCQRMKGFIGSLDGLPADLAINHDHYLHGQQKRQ